MNPLIISNRFTKEYKVKFPFVAAGMAFIGSTPDLAIAVCEAGGIGSLGVGPLPPEAIRPLVREVKKSTSHPFHVNFITLFVTEEHIKVCIEEKVPIVSFHFGHPPKKIIDLLHAAKIKVWEQVGSVENARKAVKDGIDLVIAQGSEAGGHNFSSLPTFVLVPQVAQAIKPAMVLAAGGIATGKQVAAALCLGADAVWVGTRLVASNEAFAHPEYKKRLINEDGTGTAITPIFGPELPEFNPMRVIRNAVVKEFTGREDEVPTDTSNERVIGKTSFFGQEFILRRFSSFPPIPATEGDFEEMALLAGQAVGLVHKVEPVKQIISSMMDEAAKTLASIL
ncbi:MAG: nitronate monooxygenase [Rhizobacter sp.]|nr:nitronate monooxygenase [Ferruginibacter sp.]